MNNDLMYLNQLQSAGMIQPGEYLNQLGMMYAHNPDSFSQEETDFIEKQFKAADIPFGRDMEVAEQSIVSIANQFISGFSEGFTTFGWAEEADTAAERIAANMGHLAGFAPDLVAAFWTWGASTTLSASKLAAKGAIKGSKKAISKAAASTTMDDIAAGVVNASEAKKILGTTSTGSRILTGAAVVGSKISGGISKSAKKLQDVLSEVAQKSEKLGPLKLSKKIMNEDGRPYYMLRSLPMRAADVIMDAGKKGLKAANIDGGIVYDSWLMRKTLGSDAARNMTEEGLRLGLALGASSWKEGPEEMGRAAFHGAIAGAFFGGVGEYVKIGRLFRKSAKLSNEGLEEAARKLILEARKKVKNRSRKINNQTLSRKMNELRKELEGIKQSTIGLNNEQALDMWAKGFTGSAFTGIQASMHDLPLPDQLYEYALGFFFGASGRSHKDKEYYGYLFGDKTAIKPSNNMVYDLYTRKKTQEWLELDPSTQKRIERHYEEIWEQQVDRRNIIAGNVSHVVRQLLKENPELAEKVLEQQNLKQKDKDPDVIELEKKAQQEGKDVIELAREESLKTDSRTNRERLVEEAQRIKEEKDKRMVEEVEKDIDIEIDRRIEPTTDLEGNIKSWKSKVKYGRKMTEEALYKKARKDGREGKNSYKDLLKKYGKEVAQLYTLERKRVEAVKKKSVSELKTAEKWEIEFEAAKQELKALAEMLKNENGEGINFTFETFDQLRKTLEDAEAGESAYNQAALEVLTDTIYRKYELFNKKTNEFDIPREELKTNLKRLVYDAEFNFAKFKELFKQEYPDIVMEKKMVESFKEFLKTERYLIKTLGPIITTKQGKGGKPESVEIIPEGVPEINGRDQSIYKPANKVNQLFALPGENVRQIVEKIWSFKPVYNKWGKKTGVENKLTNPLDVLISAITGQKPVQDSYMFSNRELMDLVKKELPEDWYLFGGSKDTSTLIIQRYPYQSKEKGREDYISEKDLLDLDAFFDKKGIEVESGLEKERTANVIWELVENGLITKNKDGISVESIKEGFETYKSSSDKTGYGSVVKWNKYQTLAQGNEIPLDPLVFRKILEKGESPELSKLRNERKELLKKVKKMYEESNKAYEEYQQTEVFRLEQLMERTKSVTEKEFNEMPERTRKQYKGGYKEYVKKAKESDKKSKDLLKKAEKEGKLWKQNPKNRKSKENLKLQELLKENENKIDSLSKSELAGDPINVWSTRVNGYEKLSNLAPRKFEYEGRVYQSVEHAYQTLKSGKFDKETYNHSDYNNLVWQKKTGLPADKKTNIKLMKSLIKESIKQNEEVAALLKQTNNSPIEHVNPSGKQDIWTKEFPKILQEVRAELFPETALTSGSNYFRGILVEDLPSSIVNKGDVIKSNQSGTDGVIYTRDDVLSAKADDFGIPVENGFYKPVGFIKARDGKGLIRMKAGGFAAGEKLNKWMHANNVHYVIYDSSVKVGMNRPVLGDKDFRWNEKTKEYESKELGLDDVIRFRPEEMHINMGVKEEGRKTKKIAMIKGMYDKTNQTQFSSTHRHAIDIIRERSISGDPKTNREFLKQLNNENQNKDFSYEKIDIDKVDIKIITATLAENPTSEASRNIMKRILQSTKEESMNIKENWEIDLEEVARNQDLSDILPAMDYLPIGYLWKTFQPFSEKATKNYLVARATRMKQDYGFYQKLGAYDAEIRSRNNGKGIRNDEFMLASGHKKDMIDVNGKEMNLEVAYNEYVRLTNGIEQNKKRKVQTAKTLETIKKMEEKLEIYGKALTYAITRAPVSGNGGVRVLRFAGFLKRKGYTVHTNELNDYYLGGADKDGDAVHAVQRFGRKTDMVERRNGELVDVDTVIKEGYRKVRNELEMDPDNPGKISDIKDPEVLKDIFGVEEKTFKNDTDKLASIFDPLQRLSVAKNASLGNRNMGIVVNAYTRMQWLYDTIQTNGSRVGVYGTPEGGIGITKIISGMQSGADIAGLYAAESLGIPTGGSGTKGHRSEAGKTLKERLDLAKRFNIEEGKSTGFPERTMNNVDNANATIAFRTQRSPGTDKTIGYAQSGKWQVGNSKEGIYNDGHRPVLVLNSNNSSAKNIKLIKDFIKQNPGVVNIAGSREASVPGSQKQIQKLLEAAFKGTGEVTQKNLYDLGDWDATRAPKKKKGQKNQPKAYVKIKGEYDNFYVAVKDGLDFMTIVKDGYNGINVAADSADYARAGHAGPSTTKAFHKYFDIYGRNKNTGEIELVKDAPAEFMFHKMFSTGDTKGFQGLRVMKDFHDSLFGSTKSFTTPESARKIAEYYLEGGTDARRAHDRRSHMNTGNFYTSLAEIFAEIQIDISPFNHYNKTKIYQLARAIAKENQSNPLYKDLEIHFPPEAILNQKELDALYGFRRNKEGKMIPLKGKALKNSEELFWDAATDMISISYATSKSQALVNELVSRGVTPSDAHKMIRQVMKETFSIKQDSQERADRIKKEGFSNKSSADKVLNNQPDSVDIQQLFSLSKNKWLSSFKKHLGWEKDSEPGKLAEGVYDAWMMANPILRRGNTEAARVQQEKLIAELNVLTKVINEAIIKEGAGYKGKVQGLDKYKELYWVKEEGGKPEPSPPLTLDTLYGMRGKVINKIRPRVDHLMKSSVVSHKNRKEYFGFIQNVLDRANAMDLTTSSKELPGIAKSLNRVQAIEQIVEEAKKPAREKKRNTPEKKSIEVEEEVLDKIVIEEIVKEDVSKPEKVKEESVKPEKVKEETTKPEKEEIPGTPKKPKKGQTPEFPKFKEYRMQELIDKFGFTVVTTRGEKELLRLAKFVRANPELSEVLEVEFGSAMEAFKGFKQSFGNMTTNDLQMFNDYLNMRYFDRGNIVRKVEGLLNIVKTEDARIQFGGKKDGFDTKNREKVSEGLKTTTIRTAEWMKEHWFEPGKSELVVKIGKDYYNVIDRGLGKFDKKDLSDIIKSEGWEIDKDGNPILKYKQEKDYINNGKEMHVLELKKVPPKLGNWSNLSLFKRVAEDLIPFEKKMQFMPDAKLIGDDGKLKTYSLEVPTSTLEMVRQTADSFHRISSAYNEYMEKRLKGLFDYINTDDPEVMRDFETVFDAVTWEKTKRIKTNRNLRKRTSSNRTYLKKIMEGKSKEYVEQQYEISQQNLKDLGDKKYHLVGIGKNGADKTVTLKEFKKMIDNTITEYLTDINTRLVQSKVTDKKNPFKVILQKNGFENEYVNNAYDIKENKDSKWVLSLNEMFLNKDGFISEKKVDSLYKGIEFITETTQKTVDSLPSINDVLYFKYHIEMKDAAQRQLKKNASDKEIQSFIKEYQKNNPLGVHKVGQFVGKNGKSDNYFPQLGHFETKAKREKLDVWMNEIIEIAGKIPAKELPADLRDKYFNGQITLQEARADYKLRVKEELEMRKGSSIFNESLDNYNSVTELLKSRKKSFAGDYTAGNLKSRSEAFLPFWKTDLKAIESYSGAISKNFFDINAGFRMNTHIQHFDKTRPFGEFTDNWSSYIKDAASNMLGYASLRSLDLHGIKKSEVELLGKFIENDLDRNAVNNNWKVLQGHQKRFLQDVADHIEPDRIDRRIIENKYPKNKQRVEKELHKLRMKNAKELADPKNIDKIGKFKLAYTLVSDEAWTGMAMRFEDMTGFKPWFTKDIPTTNLRNRRLLLSKKLQAFSAWEAKFELISLLSHPKTTITNFLGGGQNLYADVGAMNIYRATKFGGEEYLLNQVGMKNKKFEGIDSKGNKVEKTIKNYEDILDWIESTGALEGMFITEIGLDRALRKGKAKTFATEVAHKFFSKNKGKIGSMNKAEWHKAMDMTLLEVRRERGIGQGVFKVGASFMSWSEYQLRTRSFLAHYLNARELLKTGMEHSPLDFIEWNSPELVQRAIKGVESSQFMYHAAHRSNYSQTSMGRVMTRFHPYAWNSVRRRFGPKEGIYKVAKAAGWERDVYATEKGRRQFTMDMMSMALSYIFTASIFEYALSPPMSWAQDTAQWLFGDEKERERAFFSQWPHPSLAPLSIVTPPIARTVLAPTSAILSGDFTKMKQFYGYSYLPFGRMIRDVKRTIDSPAMAVDFMTGIPLHKIHSLRRAQIDANNPQEEQSDQ